MFSNIKNYRLSDFTKSRDNNFNIIRFLAAFFVLITHSFALVAGSGSMEPMRSSLGMTLGTMAVNIFFITSGFLVTGSLISRKSLTEFVAARFFRIYPALLVMVFLSVFALGLFCTSLLKLNYLTSIYTWKYFIHNSTLINGIVFTLPGVFDQVHYKNIVNGSLWTLPAGIGMYGLLAVFWLISSWIGDVGKRSFNGLITFSAGILLMLLLLNHFIFQIKTNSIELAYCFFVGSVYYVFREHILLSAYVFFVAIILLCLSLVNKELFFVFWLLVLPYMLFFIVFVPSGAVRNFNKLGDYSYGIYIYAFPVQQLLLEINPRLSVFGLIIQSTFLTLIFAVLSWHFIEVKALRYKNSSVIFIRKYLTVLR